MTNLLQPNSNHPFIYLLYFKFVNMLGKSIINDGYGRPTISLSKTSINNGGLVKIFQASFDKPILEGLLQ